MERQNNYIALLLMINRFNTILTSLELFYVKRKTVVDGQIYSNVFSRIFLGFDSVLSSVVCSKEDLGSLLKEG